MPVDLALKKPESVQPTFLEAEKILKDQVSGKNEQHYICNIFDILNKVIYNLFK